MGSSICYARAFSCEALLLLSEGNSIWGARFLRKVKSNYVLSEWQCIAGQFKIKSRTESSAYLKKIYSSIVVLIGLVSLYDAFLVYQYRQVIDEQNPFCAWLISLEPDCVSLFLAGKVLGTLSVMAILFFLFRHWSRLAVPVAASLMVFQIGLLGYLHGSDGRRATVTQIAMLSSDTFAPLTSVTSEAASARKAKHISGKSKITQPGKFSTTVQQPRFTKSERRRLRSQLHLGSR